MPENAGQKSLGIRTVEAWVNGLPADHAIISKGNRDSASRLVWFVAIAGFGFINIHNYALALLGDRLTRAQFVYLSIPWALTAISGIVAHWLLGELIARDDARHILKQHAIRAFLATTVAEPTVEQTLGILNVDDEDKDVARLNQRVKCLVPWVSWAERVTFILLLLSFASALVYPLLLSLAWSP
jgi:hypothetical protein